MPYAVSSALSVIPWTVAFTYFGSLAKSMADVMDGRLNGNGMASTAVFAVSGVLLVLVITYTTIISRCAQREGRWQFAKTRPVSRALRTKSAHNMS